jgi:thiamine biosynthesis lipoprotein
MAPPVSPVLGRSEFQALGTDVTLLVTSPEAAREAHALLAGELHAIDVACSRFRPGSELWRVNHAHGRPVKVSPLLADALATALDAARLTGGDVDPTCGGSLMRLGYDRDFARARRRRGALRQPPLPAAGWRTVQFDPATREVTVPAGVTLDLGATAKALAADRAAALIETALGCGVLVNLGGDISVAGEPPSGGWCVGIADDVRFGTATTGPPSQAVTVTGGGLATSSTVVRAWERGGASLHHIVEPATGLPVRSCWRTVSVAAATCVAANIASTAAILRGARAVDWLRSLALPSRLVAEDGKVVTAAGWPAAMPAGGAPAGGRMNIHTEGRS